MASSVRLIPVVLQFLVSSAVHCATSGVSPGSNIGAKHLLLPGLIAGISP
jgi:hypothetical protein